MHIKLLRSQAVIRTTSLGISAAETANLARYLTELLRYIFVMRLLAHSRAECTPSFRWNVKLRSSVCTHAENHKDPVIHVSVWWVADSQGEPILGSVTMLLLCPPLGERPALISQHVLWQNMLQIQSFFMFRLKMSLLMTALINMLQIQSFFMFRLKMSLLMTALIIQSKKKPFPC